MAQPVVAAVLFAATGLTPVEAESPNAERIADLYWFVSFWAALVLLAVAVPLTIFVIRYRSRGRARTVEGPQIHGSTSPSPSTSCPGSRSRTRRRQAIFGSASRAGSSTGSTGIRTV